MKSYPSLLLVGAMSLFAFHLQAQGTFQNLNFESATLPVVPPGQDGGFVSISNALPGWSGFFGTTPTTQIWHNNYSLGNANISILGPNWSGSVPGGGGINIIDGSYSAVLQAGGGFAGDGSASISQSSLVPVTAESIQMKVEPVIGPSSLSLLGVSLGGQSITMVPLSVQPNYALVGGNISAFAGSTETLEITALSAPGFLFNSLVLDDIAFSNQPVPEPRTWALLGCGGVMFGIRHWRRRG